MIKEHLRVDFKVMLNRRKISWKEEFSIGNNDIDNDHKMLIDIHNDLIDLIDLNNNREEFAMILSKLSDYTLTHFKKEEKYLEQYTYQDISAYKSKHLAYTCIIAKFNLDLYSNHPPEPLEVLKLVLTWLTEHIVKSDTDLKITRVLLNQI